MILQIRTETLYAVEMTEQQIQELSIFFDGIKEKHVGEALFRVKGEHYRDDQQESICETVQAFRLAIAEHKKV